MQSKRSSSFGTRDGGEGNIEVGAELGDFGATKWYLKVSTENNTITLKPTPNLEITSLSGKIRGVEDYWNLVRARNNGIRLPTFEVISRFWIDIVKSAYNNDIKISSDVALIPPLPFTVKGLNIVPKERAEPIEDEIVEPFCNFWVSFYEAGEYPNKTVFRLSSYDVKKYGRMSAKEASEYVDLHPVDDEKLILEILEKAEIICLPDISTIAGLRAIPK